MPGLPWVKLLISPIEYFLQVCVCVCVCVSSYPRARVPFEAHGSTLILPRLCPTIIDAHGKHEINFHLYTPKTVCYNRVVRDNFKLDQMFCLHGEGIITGCV